MKIRVVSTSYSLLIGLITFALSACSQRLQSAPVRYTVTDLGALPGGGYPVSSWDMNNSGRVVGLALGSNMVFRAFLYADGVMTDLGVGEGNAAALAINNVGQII